MSTGIFDDIVGSPVAQQSTGLFADLIPKSPVPLSNGTPETLHVSQMDQPNAQSLDPLGAGFVMGKLGEGITGGLNKMWDEAGNNGFARLLSKFGGYGGVTIPDVMEGSPRLHLDVGNVAQQLPTRVSLESVMHPPRVAQTGDAVFGSEEGLAPRFQSGDSVLSGVKFANEDVDPVNRAIGELIRGLGTAENVATLPLMGSKVVGPAARLLFGGTIAANLPESVQNAAEVAGQVSVPQARQEMASPGRELTAAALQPLVEGLMLKGLSHGPMEAKSGITRQDITPSPEDYTIPKTESPGLHPANFIRPEGPAQSPVQVPLQVPRELQTKDFQPDVPLQFRPSQGEIPIIGGKQSTGLFKDIVDPTMHPVEGEITAPEILSKPILQPAYLQGYPTLPEGTQAKTQVETSGSGLISAKRPGISEKELEKQKQSELRKENLSMRSGAGLDYERYQELQSAMRDLFKQGRFDEMPPLWKESEEIKYRNKGMVPEKPKEQPTGEQQNANDAASAGNERNLNLNEPTANQQLLLEEKRQEGETKIQQGTGRKDEQGGAQESGMQVQGLSGGGEGVRHSGAPPDLSKLTDFLKKGEEEKRSGLALSGVRIASSPQEIGFKDVKKPVDAKQVYGRLTNLLKQRAPVELDMLEKAGLKEYIDSAPGGKRSPAQVAKWVQDNGPSVEVHSYGMEGKVSEAKKEYDKMTHEWYENLPDNQQNYVNNMKAYAHQEGGHEWSAKEAGITPTPQLREMAERYAKWKKQVDAEPDTSNSPRATSYYSSISALPTNEPMPEWTTTKSGKNVQRVDEMVPQELNKSKTWNGPGSKYNAETKQYELAPKPLWQPDNLHENLPNTLGWAMIQYKTGPKGEKIAVIAEAQSRWGQELRKQLDSVKVKYGGSITTRGKESWNVSSQNRTGFGGSGERGMSVFNSEAEANAYADKLRKAMQEKAGHPFLRDYNRLILKAAIDQARKEGATHIMVSDAETAMMTEGHDTGTKGINIKATPKNVELAKAEKENTSVASVYYELKQGKDARIQADKLQHFLDKGYEISDPTATLSQEPGMRLNYDTILPKIAEELTGSKGEKVSLGEHKNSQSPRTLIADSVPSKLELADYEGKGYEFEPYQQGRNREHTIYRVWKPVGPRDNLIFRNPDSTPKTDISGLMYPISSKEKMSSLFEKDKQPLKSYYLFSGAPPNLTEAKTKFKNWIDKSMSTPRPLGWSPYYQATREEHAQAILGKGDSRKLEQRMPSRQQPGEPQPALQDLTNKLKQGVNLVNSADKLTMPADVLFDYLDKGKGKYDGTLSQHIRWVLDDAAQNELKIRHENVDPVTELKKEYKLTKADGEKIGVYLHSLQEGGRERMIASGVEPATIDKIVKNITPQQKSTANLMRQKLDAMFPALAEKAKKLYGKELKPVENYFSWQRDWQAMEKPLTKEAAPTFDNEASIKWISDSYPNRGTKTEQGFNIPRVKGAKTPIKYDAFEIYDRHIRDASHFLAMQEHLKDLGSIVRNDKFAEKYGKMGQIMVLDWLNNVARQGRSIGAIPIMDSLRKKVGVGVLAYRLGSQFVHLANVPLAMQRAGIGHWASGIHEAFSDKGQAFLRANFGETFERGGGEPGLTEIDTSTPLGVGKIGRGYKSFERGGFFVQRAIDMLNAQGTVLGFYMKELEAKGFDPSRYAEIPIDKEARAKARVLSRRAVASPMYKDLPGLLTKGSVAKTFMQFQNTFLDQWSNMRYDLPEYLRHDPKQAIALTTALVAMLLVETGVKFGARQAVHSAVGYEPKDQKDYTQMLEHEALRRIPGMGQLMANLQYGGTGVPVVDVAKQLGVSVKSFVGAEDKKTRALAGVQAGTAAGELFGLPATSQVSEAVQDRMKAVYFKTHQKRLEEIGKEQGLDLGVYSQRLKAEQKLKSTREPMTRQEETQAGQSAIKSNANRGIALQDQMPEEVQSWLQKNSLKLPAHADRIVDRGTSVTLTPEEMGKYEGLLKTNYLFQIKYLQRDWFNKLDQRKKEEVLSESLAKATEISKRQMKVELYKSGAKSPVR